MNLHARVEPNRDGWRNKSMGSYLALQIRDSAFAALLAVGIGLLLALGVESGVLVSVPGFEVLGETGR